jgi:hypothetical protein
MDRMGVIGFVQSELGLYDPPISEYHEALATNNATLLAQARTAIEDLLLAGSAPGQAIAMRREYKEEVARGDAESAQESRDYIEAHLANRYSNILGEPTPSLTPLIPS